MAPVFSPFGFLVVALQKGLGRGLGPLKVCSQGDHDPHPGPSPHSRDEESRA